ncbi:uncharacterized protein LOC111066845 isoform X2 [Drosophila obscura]|uniref:uncharacterized protein LOC111066845 isoform X2 n=1 Tax=Drosophila obscura TaxID=7282 RepID=UPI001BB0F038|nr:uncharacterized protein LOC111066845 isoform X2 [Drosophila obscura]
MDVSSSSFESSSATMDNNSSSYTGDTTLYDSALDNLSATAYKSCNDKTETSNLGSRGQINEAQMNRIYHGNHRHVCRSRSVTKSEKHDFCMRWLNSFDSPNLKCNAEVSPRKTGSTKSGSRVSQKLHKPWTNTLPVLLEESEQKTDATCSCPMVSEEHHEQGMKQGQLDRWHGHMEASFIAPSKLKSEQQSTRSNRSMVSNNQYKLDMKLKERHIPQLGDHVTIQGHLEAAFRKPIKLKCVQKKNPDPIALQTHHKLRLQHTELVRQIDSAKLRLSVLEIEKDYAENALMKAIQERQLKGPFTDQTKANLFDEALKALEAQTAATFPTQFLSEVFSTVADEDQLSNHFSNLDNELCDIVDTLCVENYKLKKESQEKKVKLKLEALKEMLAKTYQKQVNREAKSYQKRAAALKNKCFDLLKQFLKNNIPENESKEFLKELKALYEKDTQSF